MALSIQDLKNKSKSSLSKLTEELNKLNPKQYNDKDDRFWEPALDKAGSGSAVIRFLPAPDGEEVPFVRIWEHGFKGPTGLWYIEKSLTTIDKNDPVYEDNARLYATKIEANIERAKAQKRSVRFISNILVIKDPANPENDGKVFLYKYPKIIFDKWYGLMNPEFDDIIPVNPFDPFEGAVFRLRIRKKDGWRNYDDSAFDPISPLAKKEEDILRICSSVYSLKEFHDPSQFKTYEELKARYEKVTGEVGRNTHLSENEDEEKPVVEKKAKDLSVEKKPVASKKPAKDFNEEEEDFSLDSFKDMVSDEE